MCHQGFADTAMGLHLGVLGPLVLIPAMKFCSVHPF